MRYGLLLVMAFLAVDADVVVQKITHKQAEFDSIADVLHIIQKSGTIEFSGDMLRTAHIEIERYKKGKKLPTQLESLGVRGGTSQDGKDRVRFALSFVDTDSLKLAGSEKGHCRLVLKLNVGASTGTKTLDVPKEECDFSRMTSGGQFGPQASTKDRIPLFWMIDSQTGSLIGGSTPEEAVKNNPKGDMAIVYIRLSE
jgi:hypothetical protein